MSATTRMRLFLARYGMVVGVALILVAGLAAAGAWSAWPQPTTETITEEIDRVEFSVSTTEEADVTGQNLTLYQEGDTLVDMPVYFYDETPELRLIVDVEASADQAATLDQRLTLEIEAVRNGETFYNATDHLAVETIDATDGRATMETTVDMREIRQEIQRVSDRAAGAGSVNTEIALTVGYATDRYEGELEATSEVVTGSETFWLEDELTASETHVERQPRVIEHPPEYAEVAPHLIATIGALLLGIIAIVLSHRGFDVERLETDLAHEEFDEWISSGSVPTSQEREYVSVDTLEDLVDVAIDSNKRVIYDDELEVYAVVDADVVYYYVAGEEDIREWLEL